MSASTDEPEIPDYTSDDDREEVLEDLNSAMEEAFRKFAGDGRIRSPEKETVRIKYLRAFTSAVGEYRRLLNDLEEKEQEERISRLESMVDQLM